MPIKMTKQEPIKIGAKYEDTVKAFLQTPRQKKTAKKKPKK